MKMGEFFLRIGIFPLKLGLHKETLKNLDNVFEQLISSFNIYKKTIKKIKI